VYALAVEADGKILLGGAFTTLSGQPRRYLGRLHSDGTLDAGYNPGADGAVYALGVQADGKVLVGGWFTALGGQPRANLARLNPDGTLDSTFNPGASLWVHAITLQPDGKILVGGGFSTLGGQSRERLARLNPDGTLDATFNPGANGSVSSLALQADGKILVGGEFTTLGGQARHRIGRLNPDGTLDAGFNPGANDWVFSLAVQPDGKILAGGGFTTLGGQTRLLLARLNADGSLDTGFNPGAAGGRYPGVYSLVVQTDGKILVGGEFTTLGGQSRSRIGRLNADGRLDLAFNAGANDWVRSLAMQANGKILAGGSFNTLGGQSRSRVGRLNSLDPTTLSLTFDGSTVLWLRGGAGPEAWRTTFEVSTDATQWIPLGAGSRVPGGWQLTGASFPPTSTIRARGYISGSGSSGWFVEAYTGRPGLSALPASRTNDAGTTAVFSVVAGGSEPLTFQWLKGGAAVQGPNVSGAATATLTLNNVLRADQGDYSVVVRNTAGSVTSAVASLTVIDPAIVSQPESQTREPGQSATFLVTAAGTAPLSYQWSKDGVALDGAAGNALSITDIKPSNAGNYRVVVSSPYGSVTSRVATLSVNLATPDSGFNPGASGGNLVGVRALTVQNDERILVGGGFATLAGQPRGNLGRLQADGTADTAFNSGSGGSVHTLAVQTDGWILVGGQFTSLNGQPRNNLGRLNASGGLDTGFNPNPNGAVFALGLQTDGKILVGGDFFSLQNDTRIYLGRLNPDGTLDTTFNPGADGAVLALLVQPDGKILVGGAFTWLGGQTRGYLARLNANGTLDTTFNAPANGKVYSLALQPDRKILVGGTFTTLSGQPRQYLARLNPDGTLDPTFTQGASGSGDLAGVYALAVQGNGKILVGGRFDMLAGQPRVNLARLDADGTLDSGFAPGASGGTNAGVYGLALQADGKILVGGQFTTVGGQPRVNLARLDNTDPVVKPSLEFALSVTVSGGSFQARLIGTANTRVVLEASSDLINWAIIATETLTAGGLPISIPVGSNLQQYYRARQAP
jgi:uncharacterized delta-60 repeat protein